MMPMPDWLVLSRAWGAKNGERFRQAWNTANANSEDDAALVAMLAFWTDDPRQIERLWLSSPCGQREKTQNRADYRATTIEFVQEARHAV
jgi:primase-polymerase (primpol)-like protein